MTTKRPGQLALNLDRPQEAAYPKRSPQDLADRGLDVRPLVVAQEVIEVASTAPPDLAKRARQDLAAQLADLARERGRHPVPKHPGADEVTT